MKEDIPQNFKSAPLPGRAFIASGGAGRVERAPPSSKQREREQVVRGDIIKTAQRDYLRVIQLEYPVLETAVLLLRHVQYPRRLRLRVARGFPALFQPFTDFFFDIHILIL